MSSSMDQAIDIRYYARVLWRRKGIIFLCTVTVICATAIAINLMPNVYESNITLLIEGRQRLTENLERFIGPTGGLSGYKAEEREVTRLSARIRSRPFLERVIRRLQMETDPVVRAQAEELARDQPEVTTDEMAIRILVGRLKSNIRVGARNGTYGVTVSDYSARNAHLLAHWIGLVLIEMRKQEASEFMQSAREFGIQYLRFYEQQVRAAEDSLERFRASLIERGLEPSIVHTENLARADRLERRIRADQLEAEARVAALPKVEPAVSLAAALLQDSAVKNLAERVGATLNAAVTDQLSLPEPAALPTWPPQGTYDALRRELFSTLESRAAQSKQSGDKQNVTLIAKHAFYRVDAQTKSGAAEFLQNTVRRFKQREQSRPLEEMELNRLENEVAMYRQLLESFRQQKVGADLGQSIALTSLGERVEILSPAQLPLKPSRPNKLKLLLAAMLMGPCLGAAAAFVSLLLDPTSRSLVEFRRVVPEPILGTTPLMSALVPRQRGLRRYWIPAAVTSVLLMTAAFFMLRGNLRQELANVGRPVQVVNPEVVSPQ